MKYFFRKLFKQIINKNYIRITCLLIQFIMLHPTMFIIL